MLGNISYERKIGKVLNYFLKNREKITKKRGFCPGVRLGESMLGNRFLKTLQKPQEKPQKTRGKSKN